MPETDVYVNPNVWPNYDSRNVRSAAQKSGEELGKDQFLKILVAQLKYQDPMQPMQDKEFIAQLAQFTAVEQMTTVAKEVQLMRQSLGMASSLIGKSVSWLDEEGQTQSGVVDAITLKEGKQYLIVDDEEILPEQITKIWNGE